MSIEQFEISLGSRIAQVPARQNLKAMQYQEARRAALEASKAKAVLEELIVHEPIAREELHAEYNSEEFTKLTPEVLPAQGSEDTVAVTVDARDELESTSDDVVDEPEDIVLVHESAVLELDDDNFEIQEIQEENK